MASRYLVHLVNPVSGWAVTAIHAIAADGEAAVDKALKSFGITRDDLGQTLSAIPQFLETVADEAEPVAVEAVKEEPVPETAPQVLTEAEQVAEKVIASLPADVIAAIRAAGKE